MEQHTPKSKRVSLTRKFRHFNENDDSTSKRSTLEKTPTQRRLSLGNDCSPVYIPHTQEVLEQLDVGWDWNSPETKHKQKRLIQKRAHGRQSPKPIKRHPSNNEIESYNKLKHELEALKNQLVESRFNDTHAGKLVSQDEMNKCQTELNNVDDLFGDDSLEEEMILQSQKIEKLITTEIKHNTCDNINVETIVSGSIKASTSPKFELRKVKSDNNISSPFSQYGLDKKMNSNAEIESPESHSLLQWNMPTQKCISNIKDDSFDCALQSYSDKIFEKLQGNGNVKNKSSEKSNSNKMCNLEEIERKRLQAVAKLQSRKQVTSSTPVSTKPEIKKNKHQQNQKDDISPIKCSPEEIEQKRLQALAKLQAKKKQEKIERNRKEALKRLEMNKLKRTLALQNLYKK